MKEKISFKQVKELIVYSEQGVMSKEIYPGCTLFSMAANTAISEHTTTKQGWVYVLEGKGIFNLQGEDIVMGTGVLIPLEKQAVHSLQAEENTSFLLFLF